MGTFWLGVRLVFCRHTSTRTSHTTMPYTLESVFPPERYEYIPKVAVFKTHRRIKNGKVVNVTKNELDAIANVHNHLFSNYGRFSPFSKGHTLDQGPDGADVDESDQPDTCGGGVNLFVERSPDPSEDAHILYCTWAIPKDEKEEVLKRFVSISPEYFPSKDWIFPFSLLKSSAPEIPDMPIIPLRYSTELQEGEEPPYRLVIADPFRYSNTKVEMNDDKKDDKDTPKKDESPKKDDKPEMEKAKDDAKKGSVEDKSDLAEIKEQLAQIMQVMPDLLQLVALMKEEPEGGDDLMGADKDADSFDDKPSPDMPAKPVEKDSMKDMGSNPVKFDAMPSATNCNVPGYSKDKKEDYSMNSEEVVKYKNEVAKLEGELKKAKMEQEATAKIAQKLHADYKKNKAKEHVAEIETVCKYRSDKAREDDLKMLEKLDDESAAQYVAMAKDRYERKLPDSEGVKEAVKYAVEGEPDISAKTPEEAYDRIEKILKSGLSREEWYKQMAQGKK